MHGIEDIIGAIDCYLRFHNEENPKNLFTSPLSAYDLSKNPEALFPKGLSPEVFWNSFDPEVFIRGYIDNVLNHRYAISGSILGLCEDSRNLPATFSSCGFIFTFPPENLIAVDRFDLASPVIYETGEGPEEKLLDFNSQGNLWHFDHHPEITLDSLLLFPRKQSFKKFNEMKEVTFALCAENEEGEIFVPSIKGIFINSLPLEDRGYSSDSELYKRSIEWQKTLRDYVLEMNLPVVTIEPEESLSYEETLHPNNLARFTPEDLEAYGLTWEV